MSYWVVAIFFILAAAVATWEVFWQTADYDTTVQHELVRLNHMAALRGDPPMALSTFREEIIRRNLADAATAFQRQFERCEALDALHPQRERSHHHVACGSHTHTGLGP